MCQNCMAGQHIWDLEYEKAQSSQKLCLCCNHVFLAGEDDEEAAEHSISWNTPTLLDSPKPVNRKQTNTGKDIIRRRG